MAHIASRFGNIHIIPVIEKPAKSYKGKCSFITGALVKEIVHLHGGTIYASNRPEAGSRFEISLPLE